MGDHRGADQDDEVDERDERDRAEGGVQRRPVQDQGDPDQGDEQEVEQHRPDDAADEDAPAPPPLQLLLQGAELLVLSAPDDLVRAHDLLARLDLVEVHVDAAPQLLAGGRGRRGVLDERGSEEGAQEFGVHGLADLRARIGVSGARAGEKVREGGDPVHLDRRVGVGAPDDDLAAQAVERAARDDARGEPPAQLSRDRARHRLAPPRGGEVRGLLAAQLYADGRRRALHRRHDLRGRRSGAGRAGDRRVQRGHEPLRGVQRGGAILEDRLPGPGQLLALARELVLGLGHGEGERRDDVLRRDRADLVERDVDRGRGREEHVGEHGERERERDTDAVEAQQRPAVPRGRCRRRALDPPPEIHQSPASSAYALMIWRTSR
jgi:hypothetical protein